MRILSCDKDMMQLVDDEAGIDLALTGDGMIYRERDVVASLAVAPCKVPLLKALAGDIPMSTSHKGLAKAELLS